MRAHLFVACFSLAVAACSSEASNPTPPIVIKTDSGTGADTGSADTGSAEDAGANDTASCIGDGGCFRCAPTTNEQFLNRCTSIGCSKFDEKTRIPSTTWDGGVLPAVP